MRPSASSLALLDSCSWWARDEVPAAPRVETDYQALGTAVHAAIEVTLDAGEPVLDELTGLLWDVGLDELLTAYRAWREWCDEQSGAWDAEVAVAWDRESDTAREMTVSSHRAYSLTPLEIPGTMDALALEGRTATVYDWKIGDDWQGYTAPARENRQLALYALAVSRLYELDEVTVCIVHIASDGLWVDSHTYDAFDLDALAHAFRAALDAVSESVPVPGAHCGRCPAAVHCPAARDAALALVERVKVVPLTVDSAEAAGSLRERITIVDQAVEQAKAALATWGDSGGEIVTSDGKRLRRVELTRKEIVLEGQAGAEAEAILREYGCSGAIVRPAPRVSKSGIDAALKSQGIKVAPVKREIESRLDAAGAIRTASHGSRWLPVKE